MSPYSLWMLQRALAFRDSLVDGERDEVVRFLASIGTAGFRDFVDLPTLARDGMSVKVMSRE